MAGGKPFLALDSSVADRKDYHEKIRLDVEYNRILFEFPQGLSTIPLIEECRALNGLDDFDLMFDITMQLLVTKPVMVYLRDYNGNKHIFEKFIVTDRYMDLRGVPKINEYPIIVNWLVSFIADHLRKKYPRPSVEELLQTVSKSKKKQAKQKPTESATT